MKLQRFTSSKGAQEEDEVMQEAKSSENGSESTSPPAEKPASKQKSFIQASRHDCFGIEGVGDAGEPAQTPNQSTLIQNDEMQVESSDDEVSTIQGTPVAATSPNGVPIASFTVSHWLEVLGGAITAVDGNGQCGWMAWFAAFTNSGGVHFKLTPEQSTRASAYKTP